MGWIIDIADGGGGGISQRVIVPPDSPFANAAAVATFYANQPNRDQWLRNSTEASPDGALLTVIVVDDNTGFPDAASGVNTYQWGGADQATTYDISDWVIYQGLNAAEIKDLYESNPDTNAFTDAEKAKLDSLNNIAPRLVTNGGTAIVAQVNQGLLIDMNDQPATVDFPNNGVNGDNIVIYAITNTPPLPQLTINAPSGSNFFIYQTDGSVVTDPSATTTESRKTEFTFISGSWRLFGV